MSELRLVKGNSTTTRPTVTSLDGIRTRMAKAALLEKVAALQQERPHIAAAVEGLLDDLLESVG